MSLSKADLTMESRRRLLCRRFPSFSRWIMLLALVASSAFAQMTQETRAFDAAIRSFQLGTYDRAQNELATFVEQFPGSARIPEALLLQAQCALRLKQLEAARGILTTNSARAGEFADQYRYWLGETHIRATNYQAAADTFARLIMDFPTSPRLLEAAYGEALARFRLGQYPKVIELLSSSSSVFRRAAAARIEDELVMQGDLLLAESYVERRQLKQAFDFLKGISEDRLSPEFKWRRQYLLCRTLVLDRKFEAALAATTNLLVLAPNSGEAEFIAESIGLRARVLEQLGDLAAAAEAYEQNLAPGTPPRRRRQALLKTVQLTLAQDKLDEAAQKLESFLLQNPEDKATDFALLALGELYLKQQVAHEPGGTSHLDTAATYFDRLITNQPPSALRGRALLDRGWCYWVENKYAEAHGVFRAAVDTLGPAQDQAIARLKLGDCLFQLKDYTNAITQYRLVATRYLDVPRVRDNLVEIAWHQLLRASLEVRDFQSATEAIERILQDHPAGSVADYSLLLVAQNLSAAGKNSQARALFSRFQQMFPQSPLLPEVDLAVARALAEEEQFGAAIQKYEQWLARYTNHAALPKAQFNLARTHYRAGNDTNALVLFTNFLARFPTNELAPRAQMWAANYYYNAGDFLNAEKNFQMLFQNTNWAGNAVAYEARMMAGRAAFARQAYSDAEGYFTNLVNDRSCPVDVLVEAFFAYGDTLTFQASGSRLQKFSEAKEAFSRIPQLFPGSPLAPAAWGRIGDCYLQLAAQDPKMYDSAAEAYRQAMKAAAVDVRSQAEVGLGKVLEKQAALRAPPENKPLLVEARDHYLNVFNGANLGDNEKPSAFWVKEAGFAAARLAEDQQEWQVAASIYERLSKLVPPVQNVVQKKLDRAVEHARNARPN